VAGPPLRISVNAYSLRLIAALAAAAPRRRARSADGVHVDRLRHRLQLCWFPTRL